MNTFEARNQSKYISFTLNEAHFGSAYVRRSIPVFEEDFGVFIASLSSLMTAVLQFGKEYESVQNIWVKRHLGFGDVGNGIKGMAENERPREKMLENCPAMMTDTELLAMLIGSGTPGESAIDLAHRILQSVEWRLGGLASLDFPGLCRFAGMGIAKSSSIMAAMELGRRLGRY